MQNVVPDSVRLSPWSYLLILLWLGLIHLPAPPDSLRLMQPSWIHVNQLVSQSIFVYWME